MLNATERRTEHAGACQKHARLNSSTSLQSSETTRQSGVYLLASLPESFDCSRGQLDCSTDGNSNREIAPYRTKAERKKI